MTDKDVLNHANFGLLPVEKRPFGSFGLSLLINGLICAAVLVLTLSKVHEDHVRERRMQLTYLAVQPKPYVPPVVKVKMPPIPKPEVAKIVPPKVVVMPEPPRVEPIKVATVAPVIPAAPIRKVVQPPAPVVGMFHNSTPAPAAAPKVAEVAKAAGFGDPAGVAPNPNANRPATAASIGGFGAANSAAEGSSTKRGVVQGAGFGTGVGAGSPNGSAHGVVAQVGFGAGTQAASSGSRGTVSPVGFGSGPAAQSATVARVQQPVSTEIVVLAKPLPQYTAEAREMRIQGDVTLEVRFTATGEVNVLRVVNGLGHGLDEQAKLAAQRIRFKPATRDGKPVDQVSVIHVAFQLA
jgi:TonB family protein